MLSKKHVTIYIAGFTGPLVGNAILALIPSLKTSFNVDATQVLLAIPFFMLPFAFFQLFSGTISDIYDRKKTVIFGFSVYAFGSFLCALSVTNEMFLTCRIIQGFGFGFTGPVLVAMLGDITNEQNRGKAMGVYGAAITAGIAMGPLIAGFLADIDWRYAFYLFGTFAIVITALFWTVFRKHRFIQRKGSFSFKEIFAQIRSVISQKNVSLLCIAGFLGFLTFIGTISFTSDILSLPPFSMRNQEIGIILASAGVAGIISSPFAGILTHKIGRKRTAIIGFIIVIGSLSFLSFADSFQMYILLFAVLGSGTAVVWAPLLTLSVELVPQKRGTVSSVFNSFRFFGYALAPLLLFSVYIAVGIEMVYVLGIFFAILSIILVYLIKGKSPANQK